MKITIDRRDVHVFERLASKLFRSADLPLTASFVPCSRGLQFLAFSKEAVLSLLTPTLDDVANRQSGSDFTLPWSGVKEIASKKHDEVELDVSGDTVSVTYMLRGVPQHRTFPSLGLTEDRLPPVAENTVAHSLSMFDALVDAGKCVDPDNSRYSLGSICLRGSKAQIVSTDGRQALMQDGFAFPWDDDVLCPVSRIFGSKELREQTETVRIGTEDGWIMFAVGPVTFWLKAVEGKFPQLDQFTKNIGHFTWLNVDPGDAAFASQRLDNLPGKADRESPVYVNLDEHAGIRGHDRMNNSATEIRLTRSRYEGKGLTMPMNRRFLKNALGFGVNRRRKDLLRNRRRAACVPVVDRRTPFRRRLDFARRIDSSRSQFPKPTAPVPLENVRQRTRES